MAPVICPVFSRKATENRSYADEKEAQGRLRKAGYQGQLAIGGNTWISPENFPVDVLLGVQTWIVNALEAAQNNRDGQGLPILPLPSLVLMKFQAGRVQDIADVARMLGQATKAQLTEARQLFQQWLPNELEGLESLILLGQLES